MIIKQRLITSMLGAVITILLGAATLGCATPGVKGGKMTGEEGRKSSYFEDWWPFRPSQNVAPLFPSEKARRIFLINALQPQNPEDSEKVEGLGSMELYQLERRLQYAYKKATDEIAAKPDVQQQITRNGIQSQLMGSSDDKCSDYIVGLQNLQSNSGFLFGAATTILGGLGAIFTPAATARALAGAAGITSGVGAEFDNNMFQQKAISVIAKGMEARRQRFRETSLDQQRKLPLREYTLQEAVADIERYHGFCHIVIGFTEAEDALVERTRNVGLTAFGKIFKNVEPNGIDPAKDLSRGSDAVAEAETSISEIRKTLQSSHSELLELQDANKSEPILFRELAKIGKILDEIADKVAEVLTIDVKSKARDLDKEMQATFAQMLNPDLQKDRDVHEKKLLLKKAELMSLKSQLHDDISTVNTQLEREQKSIKAIKESVTLKVIATGEDGKVKTADEGIDCGVANPKVCQSKYPKSSEVELLFEIPAELKADWAESNCRPTKLRLDSDMTCTAKFSKSIP